MMGTLPEQQASAQSDGDAEALLKRISSETTKYAHKRRFERHSIFALATMTILDRGLHQDGLVIEISEGGAKFRPASAFILERNGSYISLQLDDLKVSGIIRASKPDGYGIQFLDHLSPEQIEDVLQKSPPPIEE